MVATRRPPAMAFATFGPALATLLTHLVPRLVELGTSDASVAVEIEPIEPSAGTLLAALIARLAGLFGRYPPVAIEIEPLEALLTALNDLLTGHVGAVFAP